MMARNFAWMVLIQDGGVVQGILSLVGLSGVTLLGTATGVALSMTQVMLPFMVLPMFSAMQQIDRRLLLAGQSLGASRLSTFRKVYLPLSLPGVISGGSLVFVLALGFYVTPALLGSPQSALIAQIISVQHPRPARLRRRGRDGHPHPGRDVDRAGRRQAAGRHAHRRSPAHDRVTTPRPREVHEVNARPVAEDRVRARAASSSSVPTLVVIPMSFSAAPDVQFPPQGWSLQLYERLFTSPEWSAATPATRSWSRLLTTLLATDPRHRRGAGAGHAGQQSARPGDRVPAVPDHHPEHPHRPGGLLGLPAAGADRHPVRHRAGAHRHRPAVRGDRGDGAAQGMDASLQKRRRQPRRGAAVRLPEVTLPLALPGVLSGAVLAFITSFDEVVISLFLQSPPAPHSPCRCSTA